MNGMQCRERVEQLAGTVESCRTKPDGDCRTGTGTGTSLVRAPGARLQGETSRVRNSVHEMVDVNQWSLFCFLFLSFLSFLFFSFVIFFCFSFTLIFFLFYLSFVSFSLFFLLLSILLRQLGHHIGLHILLWRGRHGQYNYPCAMSMCWRSSRH